MENQAVDVILIEDNENDADLTIRALKRNNLLNNLIHFKDGDEALDFLFGTGTFAGRNSRPVPKVIFLDLNMARVGGIEVLERLKSNTETKAIPVVVLTSSSEDPDIQKCYALGANSYIVKPIDFANFSKTVAKLGLYWLVTNKST